MTTKTTTTTQSKSPKVPTTNGVASKIKTVAKTNSETVTANGTASIEQKLNGHIENGNADNAIIDLSAD